MCKKASKSTECVSNRTESIDIKEKLLKYYGMLFPCSRFFGILSAKIVVLLLLAVASVTLADEVNYFYDDAGRLIKVIKGSEGVTYEYDQVGNLLSISKGAITQNSPVIQGINPNTVFIGYTTSVTITGQNLFTTKAVTCNNSSISVKNVSASDVSIRAEVTVSPDATAGSATITVTTLYGSATVPITLSSSRLSFDPPRLVLTPASSGVISASIVPAEGRDITIMLRNSNKLVVSSPDFITIPSGGTASFTVNALREGMANIDSGNLGTIVLVTTESGGLPLGEEIIMRAKAVSVYVDSSPGNSPLVSRPISVGLEVPLTQDMIVASLPVSTKIAVPAIQDVTTTSLPVSIAIDQSSGGAFVSSLPVSTKIAVPAIQDVTTTSLPVSIGIDALSAGASVLSLPVSIAIDPSSGGASVSSLPVSASIADAPFINSTASSLPVSVYVDATGNSTVASLPVSVKINH